MDIEKYSFNHIMSLEEWKQLNSDLVENGVISVDYRRLCETFKNDVESDFFNFMDETGIIEGKKGIENVDVFRKLTREKKRKYRTYRKILDSCLWDEAFKIDTWNLDSISYSLLDLWEEKDKMYHQEKLMHFYYLVSVYEHIASMREEYRKYVQKEKKNAIKAGKDIKKLRLQNFYTWYYKQIEE